MWTATAMNRRLIVGDRRNRGWLENQVKDVADKH